MAHKGIPVVVVPSGGFPVRSVLTGAPLMSVAGSGFGAPITLSDRGAPFVIDGLVTGPILRIEPTLTTETVYVGTTVGVSTGVWDGVPPITYTYQWQMSNGAGFTDIPGATASTYTATADVVGYQLRARVTATDVNGSTVTYSVATSAVTAPVAPSNSTAPSVTGTARVGQTLAGTNGAWVGTAPITYARQWMRNGAAIAGATGTSYALVDADMGMNITLRVTATNMAGSTVSTSAAVGPVVKPPVNTAAPTVSGLFEIGGVLTATNGTWSASPAPTFTYQWYANSTPIAGATGVNYTVRPVDAGDVISVRVTATNSAGNATASSLAREIPFGWQPFTMRTGDSGDWIGFSNGDIVSPPFNPPVGSITNEPTPATRLDALFQDVSGDLVAVFRGDWREKLGLIVLEFDGETLSPQGNSLQGGNTFLRFSGYSRTITVDTSYAAEFS